MRRALLPLYRTLAGWELLDPRRWPRSTTRRGRSMLKIWRLVVPTYRYRAQQDARCQTCEVGFDIVQPMSDPALKQCPDCQTAIIRIVGTPPTCVTTQRWNEIRLLSDMNLRKNGFKKLVKQSNGNYVDVLRK